MEEAKSEAYIYFDRNISALPKDEEGKIDASAKNRNKFYNNDVDAFRHAYVSGVFTIVESSIFANLAGLYNEINYDPKNPVKVIQESDTGRNKYFLDLSSGNIMNREGFVGLIELGKYPGYTVASINNMSTPMSKADSMISNNLG